MTDDPLPGVLDRAAGLGDRTGLVLWLVAAYGVTEYAAAHEVCATHQPAPGPDPVDLDAITTTEESP